MARLGPAIVLDLAAPTEPDAAALLQSGPYCDGQSSRIGLGGGGRRYSIGNHNQSPVGACRREDTGFALFWESGAGSVRPANAKSLCLIFASPQLRRLTPLFGECSGCDYSGYAMFNHADAQVNRSSPAKRGPPQPKAGCDLRRSRASGPTRTAMPPWRRISAKPSSSVVSSPDKYGTASVERRFGQKSRDRHALCSAVEGWNSTTILPVIRRNAGASRSQRLAQGADFRLAFRRGAVMERKRPAFVLVDQTGSSSAASAASFGPHVDRARPRWRCRERGRATPSARRRSSAVQPGRGAVPRAGTARSSCASGRPLIRANAPARAAANAAPISARQARQARGRVPDAERSPAGCRRYRGTDADPRIEGGGGGACNSSNVRKASLCIAHFPAGELCLRP